MRGAAPTMARYDALRRARHSASVATRPMLAAVDEGRSAALRGDETGTPYTGRSKRQRRLARAWDVGYAIGQPGDAK